VSFVIMTSSVFYKFKSRKDESRVTFDGTGISVFDLKKEVILANNLGKANDFDLHVYTPANEGEASGCNYHLYVSSAHDRILGRCSNHTALDLGCGEAPPSDETRQRDCFALPRGSFVCSRWQCCTHRRNIRVNACLAEVRHVKTL
jgi:hypothetical protein